MFSLQPSGFDAILHRPRPSQWQKFWKSPCVFIAQQLYALTRPATLPKPSSSNPVTVVCISDTHNSQPGLPDGDLLIHAGDLTQSGSFSELQQSLDWLRSQPHKHKIVIAGNHDVLLDDTMGHGMLQKHDQRKREDLEWGDIIYLQDSSTTVTCSNGRQLQVYGSPRTPKNGNWGFQYPRSINVWKNSVPPGTDILITHGPPRAHLDLLDLGCVHLLDELWRVRPALHVFGHVHEGHGKAHIYYDGLQQAFEKIIIARGGVLNLVRVVQEAVLWCCTPLRAGSKTLLVNPAMVGGLKDELKRKPTVVVI